MYVCLYIFVDICMYIRMYVYMYVCMYIRMYVCCMHVCLCVCVREREIERARDSIYIDLQAPPECCARVLRSEQDALSGV